MQSCLCLSIEQKKDKLYQTVHKEKTRKNILSLISTDGNAAIIKCSECIVKVKENFTDLEDEALTKAE